MQNFEVIIIGGSYAGLSAAMSLGRSTRRVLIIDSGLPCNRQTPHSHNLLTQDGEEPSAIAEKARQQVLAYPSVVLHNDIAHTGIRTTDGFLISTGDGSQFLAKKLILATGIKDLMPDIKGFAECWGISVVHCPYCHGYEFLNRKTAILANSEKAMHLLSLVNNLTKDLTLLANGGHQLTSEQIDKLQQHQIKIIETEVSEIQHEQGQVKEVLFANGERFSFDAIYAAIPFTMSSDIALKLGCELTPNGHIKVDHTQATSVSGVFACGDNASMMRSLANAIAAGNLAGAIVNRELTEESF